MVYKRIVVVAGKGAALLLASVGVLSVSMLLAGYVVALWGSSLRGLPVTALFGVVAVIVCAAFGFALVQLSWRWRAAVGLVLMAGCFLLLPRSACAAEQQVNVEC